MYHYCTLAFYGKPPMGIVPCYDGEVLSFRAAQETIQHIEQEQQHAPDWIVETPFGPCKPIRAYMQGDEMSGRILWQLEALPQVEADRSKTRKRSVQHETH